MNTIVFSHKLKNAGWDSAELSNQPVEEEVLKLNNPATAGAKTF